MTSARLQAIEDIFHAALDCEPGQLSAFLDKTCADDEGLRRKVEALLTSHREAEGFIEIAVGTVGANLVDQMQMPRIGRSTRPARMLADFGGYELLEEIGRGGQGVVYRAHQKSLNRTVALKIIGLGSWATEPHLKRFRREAEAAASLNHPCIVPIHEVGERDGACYFSMGLVEGEQLDAILKREPMPIRCAVELIAKVARTVHYAHEHGILHRDIKPGNILLDRNGEPHLTDFGLARLVEAESTVTGTLEVLGTPSYMAPEQAAGETTKLGKATDVYGLGAVLYQLLTGQPPFAGGTTYETIRLLRDTEPRQPRQLNPKIDRDLSTICLKCLEKDPKRRYSSALTLAEDLEHWLKHEPIQAKRSGFFTHTRKWVRRKPAIAALIASLVALAAAISWNVWHRASAVLIPKSVAVLPFENLSDDPDNAYFAEGIQEEILTRLASIADLKVISHSSMQRYQSKPGNLAEIAKQLGVANILEGSVQKAADKVRVNVQLINTQTDSHLWGDTYDRKFTDILGVESEIAKRIAESLQAKLTGREEQALAVKPTSHPEAYDAYLRGLAVEARSNFSSYLSSFDLIPTAIGFYERAVQLDPNFALAWARLSRADANLSTAASYALSRRDAAKRALENAQRLEPNSPETLLALGYYQYLVLRDYEAAKTTFRDVSKMLPGSSEASWALGAVTRREGRWDESIAYYEQALELDPRNIELLMRVGWTYGLLRQFPAALKLYDRALDIAPNDPDVMAAKPGIYQAQGKFQEVAGFLSQINAQTPSEEAFHIKIVQLRLERNYGEAIRLYQGRLAQFRYGSKYYKANNQVELALIQRVAGDMVGAKITAEQALNTLEPLYRDSDDAFVAANLSEAYAAMGEKDSALKAAQRAIMLLPRSRDAVRAPGCEENMAFIQTIFGENSHAVSTLTQLLQTPFDSWLYPVVITPALLRLDPIWDPLRADPAFQKLCEEKIDKSIAVLPFENFSRDLDNAYFAEGIQEEILTRLAKIADLKVISRTSTQRYQSKARNLSEIAKQLGVSNILEGSVQKSADQARVNVRLINAQTDSHLWAESYDRKLTDILGVESEIAKRIAESLQAKLSGREEQALAAKPTNNPEAYDAYLHGLALEVRLITSNNEGKPIDSYERAVQLDPNFAVAWARLSRANGVAYSGGNDPAMRDAAKRALEQAQKLEPNSPETLLALGNYQYLVLNDYGAAKTTFERLNEMLPGSSEVPYALGRVARRAGHWDESASYFDRAINLDPGNVEILTNAAQTYIALRRFPAALKLCDRLEDVAGNDSGNIALKIVIYHAQGNLKEADKILNAQSPDHPLALKWVALRLERKYGEALQFLQTVLAERLPYEWFHFTSEEEKAGVKLKFALMQRLAGDVAGAKVTAEQARNTFEPLYRDKPEGLDLTTQLSWAYALTGEKDLALKLAERAVILRPRAKDAPWGPKFEENLAIIETMVGENSRAISILTKLLQTPYWGYYGGAPITPALLRLDPIWDPLRGDPAFQKLCEEKQK